MVKCISKKINFCSKLIRNVTWERFFLSCQMSIFIEIGGIGK